MISQNRTQNRRKNNPQLIPPTPRGGQRQIAEPLESPVPTAYPIHYDETTAEAAAAQIAEYAKSIQPPQPSIKLSACRFCGQFRDFTGEPIPWGTDIVEAATLRCDCTEARTYADRIQRKRRARDNRLCAMESAREAIEDMLGVRAAAGYGMLSMREETKQHILDTATMVYDGYIAEATVKITPCVKIKICRDRKGKLILQRNDTAEVKQEVDTQ